MNKEKIEHKSKSDAELKYWKMMQMELQKILGKIITFISLNDKSNCWSVLATEVKNQTQRDAHHWSYLPYYFTRCRKYEKYSICSWEILFPKMVRMHLFSFSCLNVVFLKEFKFLENFQHRCFSYCPWIQKCNISCKLRFLHQAAHVTNCKCFIRAYLYIST